MKALKVSCSNHGNTDGLTFPEKRGRHESCSQTKAWKEMFIPTSFLMDKSFWKTFF